MTGLRVEIRLWLRGGRGTEKGAEKHPIDLKKHLTGSALRPFMREHLLSLGFPADLIIMLPMYAYALRSDEKMDASLVENQPIFVIKDNRLIALDASFLTTTDVSP